MARTINTKIKAALLAAAAVAGLAVTATPAQALSYCNAGGGGVYICEYGITSYSFPDGTKQQFVIGADTAVWTRWTNTSGTWSKWLSMGGKSTSKVSIHDGVRPDTDPWTFAVLYYAADGYARENYRDHNGNWSGWKVVDDF
ncbi:hypothetical protein [Streptomyces bambusae]|uniref:Peptidase inhibitor family I36 n=1 Tax=Streptomyces bambusae TaxID=1550616 RepID=A0ABS6Z0G3_9ACTN|nr:hypothetical protein [Streptomyces bambusae]MBW5481229.1 hypothetical protein [Streptomyces bambusae]